MEGTWEADASTSKLQWRKNRCGTTEQACSPETAQKVEMVCTFGPRLARNGPSAVPSGANVTRLQKASLSRYVRPCTNVKAVLPSGGPVIRGKDRRSSVPRLWF